MKLNFFYNHESLLIIIDAILLEDFLMYYNSSNKSLNAKEKMTIINEFNLWLKENNIKFIPLAT